MSLSKVISEVLVDLPNVNPDIVKLLSFKVNVDNDWASVKELFTDLIVTVPVVANLNELDAYK